MEKIEKLNLSDARFLFITSQLLPNQKSLSNINNIIEQLGYVQIDTISVVERSHHHVLWTRMHSYKRNMLDELFAKKKIFEYWSHAAAYLPMKDYRYSLIRKENYSKKYKSWGNANKKLTNYVFNRIKAEGALQSKDFEDTRIRSSGWWDWKPSKDALDFLFHQGKLMVAKRTGFQKVYDLTERILPPDTDTTFPSEREFYNHLISNSINANGLASEKEIAYQRKYDKKKFGKLVQELLEEKSIVKVDVAGVPNAKYFTTQSKLELLKNKKPDSGIHILSPFDNLVIQRKKLKDFFGFDYTIECYLPEAKRKFGYFCMPVLYGDKLVCRIDAKADRANKTFIIKNIYWEVNTKLNDNLLRKFKKKLSDISRFSGCEKIEGF